MELEEVELFLIVKLSVRILSHPAAFTRVSLYVPALFSTFPFHTKGSCLVQIFLNTVLKLFAFTSKFNTRIESQPIVFIMVSL